jgi:formylmethanofuran dehydrogenase subunit B
MLGGHFNMAGFAHIALSSYGTSHSLQFSEGKVISSSDTIISKIKKKDFDCSIIVGTDPISHLPHQLSSKLSLKPMIVLDNQNSATTSLADVILPTAITGIEAEGLAYRLDQVPIELNKIVNPPSSIPSDQELLSQIIEKVTTT